MISVEKTKIEGCYILTPDMYIDNRGWFSVTFNEEEFHQLFPTQNRFIQDNQSFSKYGVIRGLHFQLPPFAQTKLVRCISGKVLDVIVDINPESKTFGQHISIELDATEHKMILIPNWCAHGFSTISDTALFQYKVDKPYNAESEMCIRYDDPDLGIDWGIPLYIQTLSQKDKEGKLLKTINF